MSVEGFAESEGKLGMYGLIVEWKCEGPLIMEGKPMTLLQAQIKMESIADSKNVIRAAVFKMDYTLGNEALVDGNKT